ncbi:MAG TPA: DUF4450 domain-containing protein [Pseudosphingobacterium sp.]|nr:DUF4450 domain-containing protein [Pseudosphingobacterium sp.]
MIKKTHFLFLVTTISLALSSNLSYAQQNENKPLWHGKAREQHYKPDGEDFVLVKGKRRFNRALYGTNTAFRVEAGDLPEFALYMPGMGGNLSFALLNGNKSKWLIEVDSIESRYRPGSMLYKIKDKLLGDGVIELQIIAQAEGEGLIMRVSTQNLPSSAELLAVYGGASGQSFSRAGDIGADPESGFYLLPGYCQHNSFTIENNSFTLSYLNKKKQKEQIAGVFSNNPEMKLLDAHQLADAAILWKTKAGKLPVIGARYKLKEQETIYIAVQRRKDKDPVRSAKALEETYRLAEVKRVQLAERVKVNTPDPYINTLGGALAIAADAIWESPTFLHGAVAWRMRLNAWRGAYVADPLGWHDRAKEHFSSYIRSQVLEPEKGPVVPDTSRHLARQLEEMGTAVFSSGYISRNPNDNTKPHHYDMNLVFFDQLFNHFQYTGDKQFIQEAWPAIKRHLQWEKRNFDQDGDGLYDAYCAIWASDALQYSGGGVAHTSAYNYRANCMAARLAVLMGEDPTPYEKEAARIKEALDTKLWITEKGWYAEYKDLLGEQLLHEQPGLWTIYHALDAHVANKFQQYQSLQYINRVIPHIPIRAKNLPEKNYYTLSTSNWQPYTWSINNVALAENLQTALAYWQGGRTEEAFTLWKSNLIESMYLGASPGNFQQLSFYDAQRGELYRDFADPIGVAARTLVEGLFGIYPDALADTLTVKPGFPEEWNHASLDVPNVHFSFKREGLTEQYSITPHFKTSMHLRLQLKATHSRIKKILVNGEPANWKIIEEVVGTPMLQIEQPEAGRYFIIIEWVGNAIEKPTYETRQQSNVPLKIALQRAIIDQVYDPQSLLANYSKEKATFNLKKANREGTFFVHLAQDNCNWWMPINLEGTPVAEQISSTTQEIVNSSISADDCEMVDLQPYFNAKVSEIFKQRYLSPRPTAPTLQLPWQGIGNWCYPLIEPLIDDSGLRKMAEGQGKIELPNGLPFKISGGDVANIFFTSQWENYPKAGRIALHGKAKHIYFLMAGTTNPMQSQLVNAVLTITYQDGTKAALPLKNPDNWWPIEQDYEDDGFAFRLPRVKPYRIYLKTGEIKRGGEGEYQEIKGFTKRAIDGGAATVLYLALDPKKVLKSLELRTLANDVVVGLMGVTLER